VRNQQHQFTNRLPKSNDPDKDEGDLVAPGRDKKPGWGPSFPGPSIIAAGPPRTKPTGGSRDHLRAHQTSCLAIAVILQTHQASAHEPTSSPSKSRGE